MDQLLQQLVNGVLIGLVYSLLAIGLTLVWGAMNVLNFAHGDFLKIGMFLSYWLYVMAGVDPLLSIPVNAVALFLLGMFVYRFIISKVMHGPGLAQLVVTFGVSIFIANFATNFTASPGSISGRYNRIGTRRSQHVTATGTLTKPPVVNTA